MFIPKNHGFLSHKNRKIFDHGVNDYLYTLQNRGLQYTRIERVYYPLIIISF